MGKREQRPAVTFQFVIPEQRKDVTQRDEVICRVFWHAETLRFLHSLPGLSSGARYRRDVLEFEYRCSDVVTEQNFFNFFLWKSVLNRVRATWFQIAYTIEKHCKSHSSSRVRNDAFFCNGKLTIVLTKFQNHLAIAPSIFEFVKSNRSRK